MNLNAKGRLTIPAVLRAKYGMHEGDEVDVIEEGGALRIVRVAGRAAMGSGRRGGCAGAPRPGTCGE